MCCIFSRTALPLKMLGLERGRMQSLKNILVTSCCGSKIRSIAFQTVKNCGSQENNVCRQRLQKAPAFSAACFWTPPKSIPLCHRLHKPCEAAGVPFSCIEGTCKSCVIDVKEGMENLTPYTPAEQSQTPVTFRPKRSVSAKVNVWVRVLFRGEMNLQKCSDSIQVQKYSHIHCQKNVHKCSFFFCGRSSQTLAQK